MWQLEAWENELFDQYNGEGHMTQEEFELLLGRTGRTGKGLKISLYRYQ